MVQLFVIKDTNTGEYYVRHTERTGDLQFTGFNVDLTYAGHKKDCQKIRDTLATSTGRTLEVLPLVANMAR